MGLLVNFWLIELSGSFSARYCSLYCVVFSTLFSKASSPRVTHRVSNPYKTTGKIYEICVSRGGIYLRVHTASQPRRMVSSSKIHFLYFRSESQNKSAILTSQNADTNIREVLFILKCTEIISGININPRVTYAMCFEHRLETGLIQCVPLKILPKNNHVLRHKN
jgi:hypothetical protein